MKKVQDHYFKKAKKEGYRARSAYKLQEIDEKHNILRPGYRVIDLGAYPGSWSQYASKKVGKNGLILAIDLKEPAGLGQNVRTVKADVFDLDADEIKQSYGSFNGVISDMAPATTGARDVDHYRSMELAEQGLKIALQLLKPDGVYLCKVFDGQDLQAFRQTCFNYFNKVKNVKPKSSRSESFELFVLCLDKKKE